MNHGFTRRTKAFSDVSFLSSSGTGFTNSDYSGRSSSKHNSRGHSNSDGTNGTSSYHDSDDDYTRSEEMDTVRSLHGAARAQARTAAGHAAARQLSHRSSHTSDIMSSVRSSDISFSDDSFDDDESIDIVGSSMTHTGSFRQRQNRYEQAHVCCTLEYSSRLHFGDLTVTWPVHD